MTMTPDQLRAAVVAARPGRDWDQLCQAFIWNAIDVSVGAPKVTYPSAKAARLASTIVSKDPNAAPPGAIHYWIIGEFDHDGLSLGNGFVAYATAKGDTVATWATHLKVSHASSYPATYAGWSYTNGANQAIPVTAWPVAALTGTQRQVLPTSPVNRRTGPGTTFPENGAELPAGTVGNFTGWIHGQAVSNNDVWFKGTSGDWFWSGGFTDVGTHDLTNLNPVVTPPTTGPTAKQRQVLATLPTNKRSDPSTKNAGIGQYDAGTIVDMTGYITGESVSGNAMWYKAADGAYAWSGGFTDTAPHDLTNLNVVTPPPTTSVVRVVGSLSVNKRPDPSTKNATTGSVAAGTSITMMYFAHNQLVSSTAATTDLWYGDGTSWYWSGGFTTQDPSGLTDKSGDYVVTTPIVPTAFGIDVNSDKAAIDFGKAAADGLQFAIIKAGGHNTSQQYTSSAYPDMIDRARTALGNHVGHYYVTGVGTIAAEATYFVNNLHNFNVNADVLMLDNELFNTQGGTININTAFWTDDQTAEFFQKVHDLTGIPFSRLWHYFNETAYLNSPGYPKTEALGVRLFPSNYGANPTVRTPQAVSKIPNWWVAQFSSQQTVGGYGPLDGDWSQHTVAELFATGTVVTIPPVNPPADTTEALVEALQSLVTTQDSIIAALQTNVEALKTVIDKINGTN